MSTQKAIVCLPTRNEEESIQLMIQGIQQQGFDLFISDSNSTDQTAAIAGQLNVEVFQRSKPGKAWGIREALKIAKDKGFIFLVYVDCDNTYPVDRIGDLVNLASEYDMVIGARKLKDVSFLRRLVNYFHTGLVNLLFNKRFKDVNSGFRVLSIDRFMDLLESDHFDLEAELCCKAARLNIPFIEEPISYSDRTGNSTANAKDVIEITQRIFREYAKK